MGRAAVSKTAGWGFESLLACHIKTGGSGPSGPPRSITTPWWRNGRRIRFRGGRVTPVRVQVPPTAPTPTGSSVGQSARPIIERSQVQPLPRRPPMHALVAQSGQSVGLRTRRSQVRILPRAPPLCGNSSVGRARPCQGRGRGFESRFPLQLMPRLDVPGCLWYSVRHDCRSGSSETE